VTLVSDLSGHWISRDTLQVQLWVTGNWHWYLKLELRARSASEMPGRYTAVRWHPEDDNRLLVCTHSKFPDPEVLDRE
jgi:elongator complex protein 1